MHETGRKLTKIALVILVVGLVANTALSFSDNDSLNRAGNAFFFLLFLPGVLLLIVSAVLRVVGGLRRRSPRTR